MKSPTVGFEQILQSTLSMARRSLDANLCVFLQIDDGDNLCVRAVDGAGAQNWKGKKFPITSGPVSECVTKSEIMRVCGTARDGLLSLIKKSGQSKNTCYMLVPVSGQSRTLGILLCGPFSPSVADTIPEDQLRSTGALCAVLTAHWRLYEWLSSFSPQVNHELRTPLTAVQGSIGMVLGGMCGQVGGEMREMLEMAQKGCERTVLAIEEYLTKQLPNKSSELREATTKPKK